jgi:hypothetical protein
MKADLKVLTAIVGALNVLIHMRDTSRYNEAGKIGPDRTARDLCRSARSIAQEAIVSAMQIDNDGSDKAQEILSNARKQCIAIIAALKEMDTDPSFRIAEVFDLIDYCA